MFADDDGELHINMGIFEKRSQMGETACFRIFKTWNGSVLTGSITWLAGNPWQAAIILDR